MIDNNGFKDCKRCNTPKHVDFFYKLKALRPNDDGYDYYCKECRNLAVKKTFKIGRLKHKHVHELKINLNYYSFSSIKHYSSSSYLLFESCSILILNSLISAGQHYL